MIKTNYVAGDTLDPADLNDAMTVVSAVQKLINGSEAYATIADQSLKYNSNIKLGAKDISFDASADNIAGTIGRAIIELSTEKASGGSVTVLDPTDLNDVTTHGLYYIPSVTGNMPDTGTRAYLRVIKTATPSFFIQELWTDAGGSYTRMYIDGAYTTWK